MALRVYKAIGAQPGREAEVIREDGQEMPRHQLTEAVRQGKSGRPDLNRGPPAPEAGALTGLRYAPYFNPLSLSAP